MWPWRWLGEVTILLSLFCIVRVKNFGPQGCMAPLRIRGRDAFWEELGDLCGYCGPRWCVVGDFNVRS